MNSISRNDIEILVGWELIDWHLKDSPEGKAIESIVLRLKGETRAMDCDALVAFHQKTIDMNIFLAICRAGLVFDGQLVVDPELRTNDPWIFAAGTVTKYCRKLHAESWQHRHFNSVEIGERVSKTHLRCCKMLRSASPQYPSRGSDARVIRLTADQEAVLQEHFHRWPRAPHTADVVLLAAETGLSEADVEAWYGIRLAQWRKEQGLGGNLGLH